MATTNTNTTIKTISFQDTKGKNTPVRQLLEPSDYKVGDTIADLIRLARQKNPNARYSEIGKFLTEFTGKKVSTNWCYNVINNPPKKG